MPAKIHTLSSQNQHLQEPRGLWGLWGIRKLRVPIHTEVMSVSFQRSILLRDVNAHRILHTTALQEQTETTQAETHRYHRNIKIGKAILDQPAHIHLPIEPCPSVPRHPSTGTPPGMVTPTLECPSLHTLQGLYVQHLPRRAQGGLQPSSQVQNQLSGRWQRKIKKGHLNISPKTVLRTAAQRQRLSARTVGGDVNSMSCAWKGNWR